MFNKYVKLTVILLLIGFISVNAQYRMARINQNGDIVDGPVTLGGLGCDGTCKISDTGYIYYRSGVSSYLYCYDSSLNFVTQVYSHSSGPSLSIDNVRQEIVAANTITRYGPTLNELIDHDVYGYLRDEAVDQSDGAIWYTDYGDSYRGLYKVSRDFNPIYNFTGTNYRLITDVSPSGSFWVVNWTNNTVELRSSDGTVKAEGNVTGITPLVMYFGDEACWGIYGANYTVVKINSSGTIVYDNSADFNYPHDLDVDQSDGSVWVADTSNFEVVHLDSSGNELLRKSNDWTPYVVAVDPSDSTVIVLYQPGEIGIESASLGEIKAMYAEPEE